MRSTFFCARRRNAAPTRTHLNRRLIGYPDGVKDRSAAVQRRLEEAGLTRKIGSNQVRAIRINVSGTHEDMKRIEEEGRLDEWCADNLKYFADTFGKENIVAAHLHRDEETPHIHVTLVPIVKGERKRMKREEQTKKRYRKKPTDTARLCADEIMTRAKLKSYQDTYAQAMSGYGLQRGIDGSEAKHITTRQYYRDLMQQTEQLRTDIGQLQDRKETAQEELRRAKKEVQTEKLKGAATTVATNIAESVGSLFGSNKVKTLERENSALHQVVATHEETIETLQSKIQTIQADHSRQVLDMQQKHINELQVKEIEHKKEVAGLTTLFNKAARWFPQIKNMLNLEKLCLAVGFSQELTATLLTGKPVDYSGELYSEEHKWKFMAKDVKAKVFSDNGRLILTIDLRPIGEWFKEQFEKLQQRIHRPILPPRKDRGMKL